MDKKLQREQSLAKANASRGLRAEFKKSVGEGEVDVADAILNPPWYIDTMPVIDLLSSQRRWGRTRSRRLLKPLDIFEARSIGALTVRQRRILAAALRGEEPSDGD